MLKYTFFCSLTYWLIISRLSCCVRLWFCLCVISFHSTNLIFYLRTIQFFSNSNQFFSFPSKPYKIIFHWKWYARKVVCCYASNYAIIKLVNFQTKHIENILNFFKSHRICCLILYFYIIVSLKRYFVIYPAFIWREIEKLTGEIIIYKNLKKTKGKTNIWTKCVSVLF